MARVTAIPRTYGRRTEPKSIVYVDSDSTTCPICGDRKNTQFGLKLHAKRSHGVIIVPEHGWKL